MVINDGAMVLPSNYVEISQNEMEYVEGGGTLSASGSVTITANLLRAVSSAGIGVDSGLIGAGVSAALGATGVGALLIPSVIGFITSMVSDYAFDTRGTFKNVTKRFGVGIWSPMEFHINLGNLRIGW